MEELKTIGGLAQLGSFGLLCAIAFWLMKNIPKHLEALRLERLAVQEATVKIADEHNKANLAIAEEHNKSNIAIAAEHKASIKELITQSTTQARYEREECERRHQELVTIIAKSYEVIRQMRHEVANIAQSRAMEKAVAEKKKKEEG